MQYRAYQTKSTFATRHDGLRALYVATLHRVPQLHLGILARSVCTP